MEPTTPTQDKPHLDAGWESDRSLASQHCKRVLDDLSSLLTPGSASRTGSLPGWPDVRLEEVSIARQIGRVSGTSVTDIFDQHLNPRLSKSSDALAKLRYDIVTRQAESQRTDVRSLERSLLQSTFEKINTKLSVGPDDESDWEGLVADLDRLQGAVYAYHRLSNPSEEGEY